MKKLTSLIAAALILAACGSTEDPAQQYRDALPKEDAVQIGTPAAEGTAGALTVSRSALGDTPMLKSEYAVMSYFLAVTVNSGVGFTLRFLQYVTTFPPTTCDGSSCTWGPWVDDDGLNRWMLYVQKVGDAYEYTLSGQPGSNAGAPFVALITGTAYPVDRDHGSGTFTVDFDAQDSLDHGPLYVKKDFGQIVVTYDNTHDVSIGAEFLNARNNDPDNQHRLNAAYAFEHSANGGVLQIAFNDLDTTEVTSLRTRWAPSGAGRADAHYNGPAEGGGRVDYYASECWAGEVQGYVEVYDSKYPEIGPETACSPYSLAEYATVVLP
jgi:hypothetical protein